MKYLLSSIFILIHIIAHGQQNLIPNHSFEKGNHSSRPTSCQYSYNGTDDFDGDVLNWEAAYLNPNSPKGDPHWVQVDTCNTHIPSRCLEGDGGFSGIYRLNHLVYIRTEKTKTLEYENGVYVGLNANLIPGVPYVFRIKYAALGQTYTQGINHLRVHFTTFGEHWNAGGPNGNNNNSKWNDVLGGAVSQNYNPSSTQCKFKQIERVIIPPHRQNPLRTLVLFVEKGAFIIEDVELYILCPQQLLIENTLYYDFDDQGQTFTYTAKNEIIAGFDVGASTVNGDVSILNQADISYKAGNKVTLKQGFRAYAGSNFHAQITPCGGNNKKSNSTSNNRDESSSNGKTLHKEINQLLNNNFSVFPNPSSNGEYTIHIGASDLFDVEVYNNIGELIYKEKAINKPNYKLDISSFPKGMYFIKARTSKKVYTKRIIYS